MRRPGWMCPWYVLSLSGEASLPSCLTLTDRYGLSPFPANRLSENPSVKGTFLPSPSLLLHIAYSDPPLLSSTPR